MLARAHTQTIKTVQMKNTRALKSRFVSFHFHFRFVFLLNYFMMLLVEIVMYLFFFCIFDWRLEQHSAFIKNIK